MRMWCVDPKIQCAQHLLGEHNELHKLVGAINHKKNIKGYIQKGLVDIWRVWSRHSELVKEMKNRNYDHNSSIQNITLFDIAYIDGESIYLCNLSETNNLQDLLERCPKCRERYERLRE